MFTGAHWHLLVNHAPIFGCIVAFGLLAFSYFAAADTLRRTAFVVLIITGCCGISRRQNRGACRRCDSRISGSQARNHSRSRRDGREGVDTRGSTRRDFDRGTGEVETETGSRRPYVRDAACDSICRRSDGVHRSARRTYPSHGSTPRCNGHRRNSYRAEATTAGASSNFIVACFNEVS